MSHLVLPLLALAVAEPLSSADDFTPARVQNCIRDLRWPHDGEEPPWIAVYGDSLSRGIFFDTAEALNSSSAAAAKSELDEVKIAPLSTLHLLNSHDCAMLFLCALRSCTRATAPTTLSTAPFSNRGLRSGGKSAAASRLIGTLDGGTRAPTRSPAPCASLRPRAATT